MDPIILAPIITGTAAILAALIGAFISRQKTSQKAEVEQPNRELINESTPSLNDLNISIGQELTDIRTQLLAAHSHFELLKSLSKIEAFLSKYPSHSEGLILKSQIQQAITIESRRKAEQFNYWRLLLFIVIFHLGYALTVATAAASAATRATTATWDNWNNRRRWLSSAYQMFRGKFFRAIGRRNLAYSA